MPFNGSGVFQRVRNWAADATAGIKIRADYHDAEDDGFAAGISNCITKDGQTLVTQNIPMNSKRITGLADPVNPQDAATKASVPALVSGITLPLTGGTITGDLTVTGNTTLAALTATTITTTGTISTHGEMKINAASGGGNTWRSRANDYGVIFHNNAGAAYFLLTNNGDPDGAFNGLRPFQMTLSNGAVTIPTLATTNATASTLSVGGVAVYGNIPISGNPGTTDASHNQKCIIGTGGVTINGPAHVDGTCLTFYANGGSFPIYNNETMFWYSPSGGTTGNRTLGDRGICTALKIGGGHWVISGSGLT